MIGTRFVRASACEHLPLSGRLGSCVHSPGHLRGAASGASPINERLTCGGVPQTAGAGSFSRDVR